MLALSCSQQIISIIKTSKSSGDFYCLNCLGENIEKYITFTAPTKKEVTRIDKNGEEITKNISYILQFIISGRFMASSSSNIVNNLSEGILRIEWKSALDMKCKTHEIKCRYCDCFPKYTILKMT